MPGSALNSIHASSHNQSPHHPFKSGTDYPHCTDGNSEEGKSAMHLVRGMAKIWLQACLDSLARAFKQHSSYWLFSAISPGTLLDLEHPHGRVSGTWKTLHRQRVKLQTAELVGKMMLNSWLAVNVWDDLVECSFVFYQSNQGAQGNAGETG